MATTQRSRSGSGVAPWVFLAPYLVLFVGFVLAPAVYGFWISLHDYDYTLPGKPFVGLDNYAKLWSPDSVVFADFWNSMKATGIFTVLSVPLLLTLPLGVALLMNNRFRGRNLFRALYFAPYVLGVAVVAVLWRFLLDTNIGLVNQYLGAIGLPDATGWLTSTPAAWVSLVGVTVWWTLGFNAVIYLAGLQDIPAELYEAARVDGANAWQSFRNVTLPGLRPVLLVRDDGDHHRLGQHVRAVLPDDARRARRRDAHGHLLHRRHRAAQLPDGRRCRHELRPHPLPHAAQRGRVLAVPREAVVMSSLTQEAPTAQQDVTSAPRRRPGRSRTRTVLRYVLLVALALVFVSPLVFMLVTSFKSRVEAAGVPPTWVPAHPTTQAYRSILGSGGTPVLRWFANSMVAAAANSALVVVTAAMAAYPLARMRFRGRGVVFGLIVATLFVPPVILIIPNYLIVGDLKWLDTLAAVIVPTAASAFGVFFLRQFFLSLPAELEEAARLDGANLFQIFTRVVLPLSKPALVTLAVLAFLTNWNDFLWPVYVLFSPESQTLPAGLSTLQSANNVRYDLLMAGAVIASLPVLVLYCFAQRFIIEGVSRSGLKG